MLTNKEIYWSALCHIFLFTSTASGSFIKNPDISHESETELPDYRLPISLLPSLYHLRLFVVLDPLPDFQRFTATGDVTIQLTCLEPTDQIYLHAVNLTIAHDTVQVKNTIQRANKINVILHLKTFRDISKVSDANGMELTVTSLTYEIINDFFVITVNRSLEKGESYNVKMHYVAPIPDYRLNGMYQDYYQDPETSETRYFYRLQIYNRCKLILSGSKLKTEKKISLICT